MEKIESVTANSLLRDQSPYFYATLSDSGPQSKRSSHLEEFFPFPNQASIAWLDIKLVDFEREAIEIATKVGFSELIVKQLLTRMADGLPFQGGYEDFDTELGVIFPAIRVEGFNITINPLLILLRKGLILTLRSRETHIFHNIHRYAETFLARLPQNLKQHDWLTLLLNRIIDENNERNFEQLLEIDKGSEDLTRDLRSEDIVRSAVGDQIYQMKRTLMKYLSCLWATLDTINSLRYGDANLISDETHVLDKMGISVREVRDQLSLAEHLSEVLASGLECLQSIYNNQLQDKNNLLQDKNNLLQEKNNSLADLNNQLQEKNNLLQERNNKLQEYSNQLQEFNNKLQEKNNSLADLNNQFAEKNNKLQDYNNRLTSFNNRLSALNNRITLLGGFLAIISAGFVVPNTIATVMSQTNIFTFSPADMGWYLALILISTIAATLLVWSWVKRRGLLPRIQEDEEEHHLSNLEKERENSN